MRGDHRQASSPTHALHAAPFPGGIIFRIVLLAALAALVGCASTVPPVGSQAYVDKAKQICAAHPGWTEWDCLRLVSRKIWIGMDIDMVIYLNGKPDVVNVSNYGEGVQRQYCWYRAQPRCFYDNDGDGKIDAYN